RANPHAPGGVHGVLSAFRVRARLPAIHRETGGHRTGAAHAAPAHSHGAHERRGRALAGVIARATVGTLVAAAIALAAWRANSLSRSGALAALVVGALAIAAGWSWGGLLVIYFVSTSLLTRMGAAAKERRGGGIVEKGGARDAAQVLANGAVFAM